MMANLYGMLTRARKKGREREVLRLGGQPLSQEEKERLISVLEESCRKTTDAQNRPAGKGGR
jgi:hypothetical protein